MGELVISPHPGHAAVRVAGAKMEDITRVRRHGRKVSAPPSVRNFDNVLVASESCGVRSSCRPSASGAAAEDLRSLNTSPSTLAQRRSNAPPKSLSVDIDLARLPPRPCTTLR